MRKFLIRYNILIILFAILTMRIVYSIYLGADESTYADAKGYSDIAVNINTNSNWLFNENTFSHREPIFPLYVAVVYFFFGLNNNIAVYVFNSLISVFLCYYIFKLSYKIFGRTVAYLSICWSGLYIFYFMYSGNLLREILIFFLLLLFFYKLYLFLFEKNSNSRIIWLSLIFSILLLTDARYLFYIPFLFILFLLYEKRFSGIKKYFYFCVFIFIFLLPWNIRNYYVYGDIVVINTRTFDKRKEEDNVRLRMLSTEKITKPTSYETGDYWVPNFNYPFQPERDSVINGYNPRNRSNIELTLIKNNVYADSTFWGRKIYWLKEMWRPFRFHYDYLPFPSGLIEKPWSFKHNLLSGLSYGLLIPFFFTSVYFLLKKKNKIILFLIFPLVIQGLLHFMIFGIDRYRLPIDAFIIIISFYSISELIDKYININKWS